MAELNPDRSADTPGNLFRIVSSKLDFDGVPITFTRMQESVQVMKAYTPREVVSGGVWTYVEYEPESDLLCYKVTTQRTVPGLWVLSVRYDENLGPVQIRKRLIEYSGQQASLSASGRTVYEQREGSDLVSFEIEESWTNGVSPAFPIISSDLYDTERGSVHRTTQITTDLTTPASFTIVGSTATKVDYEGFSPYLRKKIIETFTFPCPILEKNDYDELRGNVKSLVQLVNDTTTSGTFVIASGVATETFFEPFNDLVRRKVIRTYSLPGPEYERNVYDPQRGNVKEVEVLVDDTTTSGSIDIVSGVAKEITFEPVNDLVRRKKTTTFTLPGPEIVRYTIDDETRLSVTLKSQVVEKPATPYTQTAGQQIEYEPINEKWGRKITSIIGDGTGEIADREEKRIVDYTFPALLFDITGSTITARDGSGIVRVTPIRRSAFNIPVIARVEITYGPIGTLTIPTLFAPRLSDVVYDGIAFAINERNVLTNDIGPLTYTSGTENPKYPFYTETFSVSATNPSADDYNDWIGTTEICIGAVIRPWKFGLERMEALYTLAQ